MRFLSPLCSDLSRVPSRELVRCARILLSVSGAFWCIESLLCVRTLLAGGFVDRGPWTFSISWVIFFFNHLLPQGLFSLVKKERAWGGSDAWWRLLIMIFPFFFFPLIGAQFGTIISMPLSGLLADWELVGGWPSIFYVFGIIGTVWCIAFLIWVYEDPEQHPSITEDEKKLILSSLWGSAGISVSFFLISSLLINGIYLNH